MRNGSPHVLCVDDDTDVCSVLSTSLPLLNLTFAHSFADALKLTRSIIFDLFLLDEWLPEPSGIELCRQIRKLDVSIPVVLISPAGYPSDPEAALAAGATAYLDMPDDFCRLECTVIGLLNQAEVRSTEAKLAEIAALRDEIDAHLAQVATRQRRNTEASHRAIDHIFRARAYLEFMNAGGVRSHFEKLWREVLSDRSEEMD